MAIKKNLKYYLSLNWSYTVEQEIHKGKRYYIIRVNELPGICTDAESIEEGHIAEISSHAFDPQKIL